MLYYSPMEQVYMTTSMAPKDRGAIPFSSGALRKSLDKAFQAKGQQFPEVSIRSDPYTLSPRALMQAFKPALEQISPFIDEIIGQKTDEYRAGYNRHDFRHFEQVFRTTSRLLSFIAEESVSVKSPFALERRLNDPTLSVAALMALGHDLGMIFDIKNHPTISADILEALCPQLTQNPDLWYLVKKGIEIHDSSADMLGLRADHFLKYWMHGNDPAYEPAWGFGDDKGKLAENPIFRQAFSAFFFADKVDLGIQRAPSGITAEEAQQDAHIGLNLYAKTINITRENDTTIQWNIAFNPTWTSGEKAEYASVLQDLPEESFDAWESAFEENYGKRTMRAAVALFGLFPYVNTFTIHVEDNHVPGESHVTTITRHNAEEAMAPVE